MLSLKQEFHLLDLNCINNKMFINMLLCEHTLLMCFMSVALTGLLASAWKIHEISSKVERPKERKSVT